MFGNVTALEGLHVIREYKNSSMMQHAPGMCSHTHALGEGCGPLRGHERPPPLPWRCSSTEMEGLDQGDAP